MPTTLVPPVKRAPMASDGTPLIVPRRSHHRPHAGSRPRNAPPVNYKVGNMVYVTLARHEPGQLQLFRIRGVPLQRFVCKVKQPLSADDAARFSCFAARITGLPKNFVPGKGRLVRIKFKTAFDRNCGPRGTWIPFVKG